MATCTLMIGKPQRKKEENMKSLDYLDEIKSKYNLTNEDLADICDYLSYIARDNKEDDTILCELSETLYEM